MCKHCLNGLRKYNPNVSFVSYRTEEEKKDWIQVQINENLKIISSPYLGLWSVVPPNESSTVCIIFFLLCIPSPGYPGHYTEA